MTYKLDDFDSEVEMLEKINEQQATINKLNKRNEYLKKELNKQIMLLNIAGRD